MDLRLQGARALVTGGASGLGAALTRALVGEGAKVALNYRSRSSEAEALVAELGAENVVPIQADLSNTTDVEGLYAQASAAFGGLDILVNNAGVWETCEIGQIGLDQWERSMAVNLRAPMILSQALVHDCTEAGRPGRILNITSQAAFLGSSTGHLPYAAAKGALVTMTRSMAREMGNNGITVNALAIGTMESPMISAALDKRRDFYASRIPIGHIAQPEEVADVALFLLSPRSGYMTGATVDVSGGQLRH